MIVTFKMGEFHIVILVGLVSGGLSDRRCEANSASLCDVLGGRCCNRDDLMRMEMSNEAFLVTARRPHEDTVKSR